MGVFTLTWCIYVLRIVSGARHLFTKWIDEQVSYFSRGIRTGVKETLLGGVGVFFPLSVCLEAGPVPAHLVQIPTSRCGIALDIQLGRGGRASFTPPFTSSTDVTMQDTVGHMWQPRLKAWGRSCPPGSENQPEVPAPCPAEALSRTQAFLGEV